MSRVPALRGAAAAAAQQPAVGATLPSLCLMRLRRSARHAATIDRSVAPQRLVRSGSSEGSVLPSFLPPKVRHPTTALSSRAPSSAAPTSAGATPASSAAERAPPTTRSVSAASSASSASSSSKPCTAADARLTIS